MARRRELLQVGAAAFLVLLPGTFFGVPNKPVAGAWRVLQGEVIYRDFWTIYAPGSYYLIAALFALFGRFVLVQAVFAVGLHALAAALFHALLRRLGASARAAGGLALSLAVALWEIAPEIGTYAGALPAMLAAWLAAVAWAQGAHGRRLLLGGLALGLGASFKHDVAAYAALATCVGLALGVQPASKRGGKAGERRALAPALARFALGIGLTALLVVALVAWKAGPDAWRDLVAFPAGDFRLVRGERYPGLLPEWRFVRAWLEEPANLALGRDLGEHVSGWALASLPLVAFALGLVTFARRARALEPGRRAGAAIALAAWPCFFAAAHVQQNTHFLSMALCSALFLTALWDELARSLRRLALALAAAWIPALWVPPALELMLPLRVWSDWARLELPVARGVFVSPREKLVYETAARFCALNVPPGEAVHAGVVRNDAIVVSDTRFYYMVDRPAATRYQELHPGITDVDAVQREMIEDLERARVRCLILWHFGGRERGDADERIVERRLATGIEGIGARRLDDYVAERFRPVLEVDEYTLLWRKDAGEPVLP